MCIIGVLPEGCQHRRVVVEPPGCLGTVRLDRPQDEGSSGIGCSSKITPRRLPRFGATVCRNRAEARAIQATSGDQRCRAGVLALTNNAIGRAPASVMAAPQAIATVKPCTVPVTTPAVGWSVR